jgi:hypothetical protein
LENAGVGREGDEEHISILPSYPGEKPRFPFDILNGPHQAITAHVGSRPQLGPVSDLLTVMFLTDMLLPVAWIMQSNGGLKYGKHEIST